MKTALLISNIGSQVRQLLARALKSAARTLGLSVSRRSNDPAWTLLGLKALPIRTIIDIGANEGQFARQFCNLFKEANMLCFEPLKDPFEKLKAWAQATDPDRIKVFNLALGEEEGEADMFCHLNHTPSSSLLRADHDAIELYPEIQRVAKRTVTVRTLDTIVAQEYLAAGILIKLDVQGFEDRVIRGGKETIKKADAVIAEVNVAAFYEGQASFAEIVQLLDELGLYFCGNLNQYYAPDGHALCFDSLFCKRSRDPQDSHE